MSDFRFCIITGFMLIFSFVVSSYSDAQKHAALDSMIEGITTQCISAYMADPVNIPPVCKEYLK